MDPAPLGEWPLHVGDLNALRTLALQATDVAFTLSDPSLPDNPLLWANPAFAAMTGYDVDEVIGSNCRFLQGPGTDRNVVAEIRSAVAEGRPVQRVLLNYRKDGSPFWNRLSVNPVFDGGVRPAGFVGVQFDVSDQVQADQAERLARERLALMAEITTELAATFDVDGGLERLADLVVPALADWAVVNVYGTEPGDNRVVARHRLGLEDDIAAYTRLQPLSPSSNRVLDRVRSAGVGTLVTRFDPARLRSRLGGGELADVVERLGASSALYAPLVARHSRVLGTLVLVSSAGTFVADDLNTATDIGRRAGVILDNARLYQAEHRVAAVLQHSLLPDLPSIDGVDVAASYTAANAANDVGGDFYEVLSLPDGAVGLAVGDVVGHDITAAAAMGHLRGLLRASAWDLVAGVSPAPAAVLDRVDSLVQALAVVPLATAVYLRAERVGGGWDLTWSNAGHPYPLVRTPDGAVTRLEAGSGVLLGVGVDVARTDGRLWVPAGTVVLAYTDGLVERRDRTIEAGIDRVGGLLGGSLATKLDDLVADVMVDLDDTHDDDVAVVALRLGGDDLS